MKLQRVVLASLVVAVMAVMSGAGCEDVQNATYAPGPATDSSMKDGAMHTHWTVREGAPAAPATQP